MLEKLFRKERVSGWGKLHCPILGNCHSHPSLHNHQSDQSAYINIEARCQQKDYNSLKAQMMVSIS